MEGSIMPTHITEHRNPLWEYEDARGITRRGHMDGFTDHGGTDVTYRFRACDTGELTVASGARLKAARRIWEACPHAEQS
jgi:hypothetical protein